MRRILALTTLLSCTTLGALELHVEPQPRLLIGEEEVELKIIGGTDQHFMEGCDEIGFHFAQEHLGGGVFEYHIYCGPIPPGRTEYTEVRDTGI